jgi:hypothetical protein
MCSTSIPGGFTVEWTPDAGGEDGLTLSLRLSDTEALKRFARRDSAPALMRISLASGASVVTDAAAILAWDERSDLPAGKADNLPASAMSRTVAAYALDMLEGVLSWSRSRGLLDENACRRISLVAQMEMAGEAQQKTS